MKINRIYKFFIFFFFINIESLYAKDTYSFSLNDYSYSINNSKKSQISNNNFQLKTQNNFSTNSCYKNIENQNKTQKHCEKIKLVKNKNQVEDKPFARNIQPYIPFNFFLNKDEIRFLVDWSPLASSLTISCIMLEQKPFLAASRELFLSFTASVLIKCST